MLSGGGGQRVYLEVAGWLYPGGARVGAPEASDPRWRGPDGRSHKLGEVLAGLGSDVGTASGPRAWLRGAWLTPRRMRFATVALLSLAVLASGLGRGGSA